MRSPYGLEIIESCLNCPHREDRLFCDLPPAALQRLASITSPSTYPKDATLFVVRTFALGFRKAGAVHSRLVRGA